MRCTIGLGVFLRLVLEVFRAVTGTMVGECQRSDEREEVD